MNSQPWLVTGAAGFLGSHVVEQLLLRQVPVIGVDNLSGGKWQFLAPFATNPLFKFACKDIRDELQLVELCRQERPVAVVHLAALHFIPAAMRDPGLAVSLNVHGTQTVLDAAREAGVRRFYYASTADVYRSSGEPHSETSEIGPFNIYGLTKWIGEQLIRLETSNRPECHFVIGRLFNLYGPRETNPHILPDIFAQLRNGNNGTLRLGNVTPKRDLVPVADAARAVIETVEKSSPGVTTVNIGTGLSVSMREVVELLSGLMGKSLHIETDPGKVRSVERPHLQADTGALKSLIGWAPHSDLSRGFRELLCSEGVIS
ncbi:MAG: NAD-dependent epimerase/dehydratase family protein [Terriglobales bacterium]